MSLQKNQTQLNMVRSAIFVLIQQIVLSKEIYKSFVMIKMLILFFTTVFKMASIFTFNLYGILSIKYRKPSFN